MSENPEVLKNESGTIFTYTCNTCLKTYATRIESDYYLKLATDCCVYNKAVNITRKSEPFEGPCFDDDGNFYSSVEEAREEGCVWVRETTFTPYRINFGSIVESVLEDHHENSSEADLVDLKTLEEAVSEFNAKQTSGSYYEGKRSMKIAYERTFAMVKPCAFAAGKTEEIISLIEAEGYTVEARKTAVLKRSDAEDLYDEHSMKAHFNDLVDFTVSGPVELMILRCGDETPTTFRTFAVESLRPRFTETQRRNGIHASDSNAAAERELEIFKSYFA